MIVSHEHRFIFLKTRKTAGTSVEIALSRFCGPDDILTGLAPDDEVLRYAQGGRGAQNDTLPFRMYTPKSWARLAVRAKRLKAYNHMAAPEVRQLVGEEVWNNYYKFSIDRNPWDACVSLYYWIHRHGDLPPFHHFVLSGGAESIAKNADIYRNNGAVAVDKVCRYEELTSDLEEISAHLNLPGIAHLPHAKSGVRGTSKDYRSLYDQASIEAVRSACATQIALLGYEY